VCDRRTDGHLAQKIYAASSSAGIASTGECYCYSSSSLPGNITLASARKLAAGVCVYVCTGVSLIMLSSSLSTYTGRLVGSHDVASHWQQGSIHRSVVLIYISIISASENDY